MEEEGINIKDVKVAAYTIPTDSPESDGTIKWDSTTLILGRNKCRWQNRNRIFLC